MPNIQNLTRLCLTVTLSLFFCLNAVVSATAKEKIVRVGWYESPFCRIDSKGNRSGYAYDFQMRIAANTGWKYEYVDGNWRDLLEMLKRGEIDLLSDVSYTASREKDMLFSMREMAYEHYDVMVKGDNKDIQIGNIKTLDGKRVAANKGRVQLDMLKKWKESTGSKIEIVETDVRVTELFGMLDSGKVDALLAPSTSNSGQYVSVLTVNSSKAYFAINKNRPDLKTEIDNAMTQIITLHPHFTNDLNRVYFAQSKHYHFLPEKEQAWLKQHKKIRIGYRDDYLPFCAKNQETGEVDGLLKDYLEKTQSYFENIDIEFEAIAYPTINQAIDAVKNGEVDLAFPYGETLSKAEKQGLVATDVIIKSAEMAVLRENDQFHAASPMRAAINAHNPNYLSILEMAYPHWKIVDFPTTYACMEGIANNEADLLLLSSYRLGMLAQNVRDNKLKAVPTGLTLYYSFVTQSGQNELFYIMNELSSLFDEMAIQSSLVEHSDAKIMPSFKDYVKNNLPLFFCIVFAILLIILVLYVISRREHKKAIRANEAKTRFLFNMSHDIRTPMNAIIGYANLIQTNINDKNRCLEYLSKMRSSSDVLLGLINNVLEMSRINSGKMELNEEPVYAFDLTKGVFNLYKDSFEQKGVDFIVNADTHTKAVYCDKVKLNEIFLNLISNAYKYTPAGGKVTVDIRELPGKTSDTILVESIISDTGCGMSKEFLPHLFDEFTRDRDSISNHIQGTGLGMPIVKKLINFIGGTVDVESELGKGTTFIVKIPFRVADVSLIKKEKQEDDKLSIPDNLRILLAEDNDINAEIAISLLEEINCKVDHAHDGLDCIRMLSDAEPGFYDCILMDIQMPNLDGYETTRRIRNIGDEKKASIPIFAMTANAFEEDKQNAYKAGMNAHLAKPIDIQELMKVLSSLSED